MSIVKHIPNGITSINLLCGFLAIIVFITPSINILNIPILVLIALIADFLDGLSARLLHQKSEIGKQLDSLADLVTFGVVPGLIVFHYLYFDPSISLFIKAIASAIIPIFTAYRLAKFNVVGGDYDHFKGLPSPANAIFFTGLIFVEGSFLDVIFNPYVLTVTILVSAFLLVSNLKMFDLKMDSLKWKKNEARYILFGTCLLLIGLFQLEGISLCIIAYIFVSLINNIIKR